MDILGLTYEQLVTKINARFGKGRYHAAALYRQVFSCGTKAIEHLPAFAQSRDLALALCQWIDLDPAPIVCVRKEQDVIKFISRLSDGCHIESVLIPMANHLALCISSQVGCRMGCRFCQTGQMGFQRNLSAAEIVGQVFQAKMRLGARIRNIVFMGMGEPLDNFDAVIQAISVLSDQRGLDIAPKHITLSTAGLVDGIHKLSQLGLPRLKLAVSLNGSDDALRSQLMPINRRYPLAELKAALLTYPLGRNESIFMEYVLIKGINDSHAQARQLARYLTGLKVKVNLIGYNPPEKNLYLAPEAEDLLRFRDNLIEQRLFVRLRASKGRRIMAACGQLGSANHAVI